MLFTIVATAAADQCQLSKTLPGKKKNIFAIKSIAVPSKCWDEAHTRQHSAIFAEPVR